MNKAPVKQESLWEWSLEEYERPGVATALLHFQDTHGFHITQILACLWMATLNRAGDSDFWITLRPAFEAWALPVINPLRQLRRHLKQDLAHIDLAQIDWDGRQAMREEIRTLELQAERLFMETIEKQALLQDASSENPKNQRRLADRNLACLRVVMSPDFRLDISAETENLLDLIFGPEEG